MSRLFPRNVFPSSSSHYATSCRHSFHPTVVLMVQLKPADLGSGGVLIISRQKSSFLLSPTRLVCSFQTQNALRGIHPDLAIARSQKLINVSQDLLGFIRLVGAPRVNYARYWRLLRLGHIVNLHGWCANVSEPNKARTRCGRRDRMD